MRIAHAVLRVTVRPFVDGFFAFAEHGPLGSGPCSGSPTASSWVPRRWCPRAAPTAAGEIRRLPAEWFWHRDDPGPAVDLGAIAEIGRFITGVLDR
ncbi:hypothetical protein [Nocardia mangyaensis]|uniref:hypothetical protein n=1 Tax=Nocardia mangyaensis TaxID=2213200 RepID=UPI002676E3BF|nr:hypothetical protein [Nocardia mangyaensis]MDO3650660.1 hypothetical protein [Nocardia mangyaensis]